MQKLKIYNLNKLINELTDNEMKLYLYLIRRQNEFGAVRNIYMKDCMLDLYMSKQGFYNALYALEQKKFIVVDYSNGKGWNCYIINNAFIKDKDYKDGYLNLNLDFLYTKEFLTLSVNLKKFLLRLLSLQSMKRKVQLTFDTLKSYKIGYEEIHILEKYFRIKTSDHGKTYTFLLRKLYTIISRQDYFVFFKHALKSYCKNMKISYTFDDLKSTVTLFSRFLHAKKSKLMKALDRCVILHSLEPKLINYICSSKSF